LADHFKAAIPDNPLLYFHFSDNNGWQILAKLFKINQHCIIEGFLSHIRDISLPEILLDFFRLKIVNFLPVLTS